MTDRAAVLLALSEFERDELHNAGHGWILNEDDMTHPAEQAALLTYAFEMWFQNVETGDGDIRLPEPTDGPEWDDYVARHALALGAWNAALAHRAEAPSADNDPVALLAEIHRLREAVKGPDGYESWQAAATDERIKRVKAEQALAQSKQEAAEPASWEQKALEVVAKLYGSRYADHAASQSAVLEAMQWAASPPVPERNVIDHLADAGKGIEAAADEISRLRAAIGLIWSIYVRKEVHLGLERYSGLEQHCIACICALALGQSMDGTAGTIAASFNAEREKLKQPESHDAQEGK